MELKRAIFLVQLRVINFIDADERKLKQKRIRQSQKYKYKRSLRLKQHLIFAKEHRRKKIMSKSYKRIQNAVQGITCRPRLVFIWKVQIRRIKLLIYSSSASVRTIIFEQSSTQTEIFSIRKKIFYFSKESYVSTSIIKNISVII